MHAGLVKILTRYLGKILPRIFAREVCNSFECSTRTSYYRLVQLVDLLSLTIESIISVECMSCVFVCLFVYMFYVWTCSEEIKVRQASVKELLEEEKCLPPQSFSISSPSHMVPAASGQRLHYPAWKMASIQFLTKKC